jgi:hypothetical protein
MKIWKITSILVVVLFLYMAKKALFDEFKTISNEKKGKFLVFWNFETRFTEKESKIWTKLSILICTNSSAAPSYMFQMCYK